MTTTTAAFPSAPSSARAWWAEGLSVIVGTAVSAGLFLAMAYVAHDASPPPPSPVPDELRLVSLPPDLPPPPTVVKTEPQPIESTVTGIDVAAAESPVRIAVSLPPLLDTMPVPVAPPARIEFSTFHPEFKPKMADASDARRVYQMTEVDQKPSVLADSSPFIPRDVRKNEKTLRVVLLMVVDVTGAATNARVLESSGNAAFDKIIIACVQDEWRFNPAVKHGKKVKCLVQRSIRIQWSTTPFDA